MCFSASASFAASALLLTAGTIAIKKSTTPSQKLLSCIPLFFGIQQFAEGILWLGLTHPEFSFLKQAATYVFLIFAQVVWPVMVPLSIMNLETDPGRKKIMTVLFGIGICVSIYLFYSLLSYKVVATMDCYHINYQVSYPLMHIKYSGIFYFLPTVIPPIISSIRRLWLFGTIVLLSYIITQLFYKEYLISVWCFFAAIVSVVILSIIVELNNGKIYEKKWHLL